MKAKVEGFLDYFQGTEFKYQNMNPQTGLVEMKTLTGQDILGHIQSRQEFYKETGVTEGFEGNGMMRDGHFLISDHNNLFDGTVQTGSSTMSFGLEGMKEPFVFGISLGTDYLKGARYHGANAEQDSINIENIVIVELGAVQRANSHDVEFTRNGNGGYHTLQSYEVPKPSDNVAPSTEQPDSVLQQGGGSNQP